MRAANGNRIGELPCSGLGDHNGAGRGGNLGRFCLIAAQIPVNPGINDVGDIYGVGLAAQQMVRVIKRDKTFRVLGCGEDMTGVFDADRGVYR